MDDLSMQVIRAKTGQWLTENILVADIHQEEVAVVVLTEVWDSIQDGEELAEKTRKAGRARVQTEQQNGSGDSQEG